MFDADSLRPLKSSASLHRQTILFDIDGTLLATGGAGRVAMYAALAECFQVTAPADFHFAGRTDRHLMTGLLAVCGVEATVENVQRLRAGYSLQLPQALANTSGMVLPGVIDLLTALTSCPGVLMGVLTGNLPETAELKLRHFGLWDYFQVHFHGDQHALRTDLAKYALAQLQVMHGECLGRQICLIGDTPFDIEAAQAIDARVIATATGGYREDELTVYRPDLVVSDLSRTDELVQWLTNH